MRSSGAEVDRRCVYDKTPQTNDEEEEVHAVRSAPRACMRVKFRDDVCRPDVVAAAGKRRTLSVRNSNLRILHLSLMLPIARAGLHLVHIVAMSSAIYTFSKTA